MSIREGFLRSLLGRLTPCGAGLSGLVLVGFLAMSAAHEHSDDPPGTSAIHCSVVAGPLAANGHAADVQACPDPVLVRLEPAAVTILPDQAPPSSTLARGPPSSLRKV